MVIRARILARDVICRVCAATKPLHLRQLSTEVDHRTPLWRGGSDDDENLQGLCEDCHKAKTAAESPRPGRVTRAVGADGWPIG